MTNYGPISLLLVKYKAFTISMINMTEISLGAIVQVDSEFNSVQMTISK